jgi:predicted DNA-binding protein (MmcQ/YjbR family)
MDGLDLHEIAMRTAAGLPAVTQTHPFGPEYEVFKVVGKVFMMTTEVPGRKIVTLKCEPPYAEALARDYEEIAPGYHMNKRHWISVASGPKITEELVEDLVVNAYHLVVEKLPRGKRPIESHRE